MVSGLGGSDILLESSAASMVLTTTGTWLKVLMANLLFSLVTRVGASRFYSLPLLCDSFESETGPRELFFLSLDKKLSYSLITVLDAFLIDWNIRGLSLADDSGDLVRPYGPVDATSLEAFLPVKTREFMMSSTTSKMLYLA